MAYPQSDTRDSSDWGHLPLPLEGWDRCGTVSNEDVKVGKGERWMNNYLMTYSRYNRHFSLSMPEVLFQAKLWHSCNQNPGFDVSFVSLHSLADWRSLQNAPGPDEIPNLILKKSSKVIEHHLLTLAQISFNTGHFPTSFKESTIIILRKPNNQA